MNISMIFKYVLFDDFYSMLLSSLKNNSKNSKIVHLSANVGSFFNGDSVSLKICNKCNFRFKKILRLTFLGSEEGLF